IYHQLGSLAVLLNSMRLLWFERSGARSLWKRLEDRAHDLDRWIDHTFNWHDLTHWLYEHRRIALAVVVALIVVPVAFSGLTIIGPDERGVVRRFGQSVETLPPGWHLRWPWPVEETTRVADRVRTI